VVPIEAFFGILVVMFTVIGIIRGFLRELGVTLGMTFVLFILNLFDSQLTVGLDKVFTVSAKVLPLPNQAVMSCWLYMVVISALAFTLYHGQTLAFPGDAPKGMSGVYLGGLVGALNGYLIAGSIWNYMHKYQYACSFFFFDKGLTNLGQSLIEFLPLNLLGQPVLFGQSLLLYLATALLLARVIH
jgi:uncharacterized membrane protein required for colicin V production